MQINPTASGPTPEQTAIAVGVILLGAAIVLILASTQRTAGLSERQKRVKVAIENGMGRQTPGSVRIEDDERLESRRGDIRRAFGESGAVEEVVSKRAAAKALFGQAYEIVRPYLDRLPQGSRRYGGLAVAILLFGTIGAGAESIASALQSGGVSLQPLQWPGLIISESAAVLGIAHGKVGSLPIIGTTLTLIWAFGIVFLEWVYNSWFLLGVILLSVAGKIWYADSKGADPPGFTLPKPTTPLRPIAGGVAGAWGVLLGIVAVGRLVGPNGAARETAGFVLFLAFVLALLAGPVGVVVVGRRALGELGSAYRTAAGDRERGRLIVWTVGLLTAVIAAPMVPVWAIVALTKLPVIAVGIASAGIVTQAAISLLLAVLAVAVAVLLRESLGAFAQSLRESVTRRRWQVLVLGRAAPVGVVVTASMLATGLGLGAVASVLLGVVAGLVALGLWRAYIYVRAAAGDLPRRQRHASNVVVHAYAIETPAGLRYIARLNGTLVASPDRDSAVNAVIETARDCFADGRVRRPTMAEAYAAELVKHGIADVDEVRDQLRADCRREIEGVVYREAGLEREELVARLERRFPPEIWDGTLDQALQRNRAPVEQLGTRVVPT